MKHLKQIDLRDFDRQVVMGIRGSLDIIEAQGGKGDAYTGIDDDGYIIFIGGMVLLWEGVGSGWLLTSNLLLNHKIWVHRTIRDFLNEMQIKYDLHRIESIVLKDHTVSMKWVDRLGYKQEGLLRKYNSKQQDHWLYARVI